ncbi:tyrosine-type recombinase/integrase [candidate division WWE3 bacterium]|jgi:integrase|nr:tyrosine-type recombinase/integrase [candidate division WWE3 bacterium]
MAGLAKIGKQYKARIHMPKGHRPMEIKIPLLTADEKLARKRRMDVERREDDIKAGLKVEFPWQNEEGKLKLIQLTLIDATELYKESRKAEGLSKSALGIFTDAANDLMDLLGKKFPVSQIGIKEIDLYKSKRKEKYTQHTIQIRLRNFKTFFSFLKDRGKIDKVPRIELLKIKKSKPLYLSNDVFESICQKVDDEFIRRVFWFYRETGCRLREPIEGTLEGDFLVTNPETSKTRNSREIFLTPELKIVLIEIQAMSHSKNLVETDKQNPIRKTHEAQHYSNCFRKAMEAAELSGYKFQNLRDSCAVRHYLITRDIFAVKTLLGHSSVVMTEKYAAFEIRRLEHDFPDLVQKNMLRPIHPTQSVSNYKIVN